MTLQLLQVIKGNMLKPSLSYKLFLAFVWSSLLLVSYLNGFAVESQRWGKEPGDFKLKWLRKAQNLTQGAAASWKVPAPIPNQQEERSERWDRLEELEWYKYRIIQQCTHCCLPGQPRNACFMRNIVHWTRDKFQNSKFRLNNLLLLQTITGKLHKPV